jgi:hypothetical protein
VLESKKKVKKDYADDDGDDCGECKGKVTELTLQYNGSQTSLIKVEQKKPKVVVFEDTVDPNGQFTFEGADDKGTLSTEISIFVDGEPNTKIHTSCSKPIGPGLVFGDFTVIEAFSLKGGLICPVDNGDDKKKKKKSKEVHLFSFSTPLGEGDLCALNEDDFLDLFFRVPCSLGVQDAFGFDGIAVIKKLEIVNKENCGTPAEMIRLEAVVCDVPLE